MTSLSEERNFIIARIFPPGAPPRIAASNSLALLATPLCVQAPMTDERSERNPAPANEHSETDWRSIERSIGVYAAFLRSVESYQKSVAEFRRAKSEHESIHALLAGLAADRASAAAGRLAIRSAVRDYVRRLRDEKRGPEVALRMTKRACLSIVLGMPAAKALRNPDALLDDTVRWAIEAYYDAA